jgi:hypothetical protein
MPKTAIVVPCGSQPNKDWIYALEREAKLGNADVIIVDDTDGKLSELPKEWMVYGYQEQKNLLKELYDDFANMFHKCSACRVFGHILAYGMGYDFVIGLDNDCIVPFYFVKKHLAILNQPKGYGWVNPLGASGFFTRGYPYAMRKWPIKANMGLWDNVLDLNGRDRQPNEPRQVNVPGYNVTPTFMPFSGMNFALTRDVLLGFLFIPNFDYESEHFRRIDDIWGGYIFQHLLRKLRLGATYGQPIVFHDTVVDGKEDEKDEEAMYKNESEFIADVDTNMHDMYPTELTSDSNMPNLMLEFIKVWKTGNHSDNINSITRVLEWWEKIINKYK